MDDRMIKKKNLHKHLKNMREARRGKTLISEANNNMTKEDRRKMKRVVKSTEIIFLLKSFGIDDEGTQKYIKNAIKEGRISNTEDMAKFISKRTNQNITAADLIKLIQSSSEDRPLNLLEESCREAQNLIASTEKVKTKYEDESVPLEKRRPPMCAPFMVSKEDLD